MKKLLLTLLIMPISLAAQVGPQPLFIQNITLSPNGCFDGETHPDTASTISVTASGGTPNSSGQYTYTLTNLNGTPVADFPSQTAVTANFVDVPTGVDGDPISYNVTVTDSSNSGSPVEYEVTFNQSATKSVSMTITSLPLGSGAGCITLLVTNPAGDGEVHFAIFPSTENEPTPAIVTKAPFQQTFSAFPTPGSTELTADIAVLGDCGGVSDFKIVFPFPQGLSNALKAYIFNKYCSCTLQSGTVKVVTPTVA